MGFAHILFALFAFPLRGSLLIFIKKIVKLSVLFICREGVKANGVNAVENAFFNIRVILFQAFNQHLYLLPLGFAYSVFTLRNVLRKAAGALQKFQLIVSLPGNYIRFVHAVKRADKLHSFKILAVELRHHRL